jgi:hypothetical protein
MFAKGISAKGSLAGFLAVFLLAMSSWSSACDLSCSLADRHLGCATGQAATPRKMAEADSLKMDMEHCPHATSVPSGEQLATSPSVTAAPCLHEACRQVAVSTAANGAAQRLQRGAACWTAMAMIQPAASRALFRPMEGEDPPPKTTPLALLSTSLRI